MKIQKGTYSAPDDGSCRECHRAYRRGDQVGDIRAWAEPVCEYCWEDADEADRE